MSESSGLTNRYAKALYELAAEKNIVSKIVKDFQEIKMLLESILSKRAKRQGKISVWNI